MKNIVLKALALILCIVGPACAQTQNIDDSGFPATGEGRAFLATNCPGDQALKRCFYNDAGEFDHWVWQFGQGPSTPSKQSDQKLITGYSILLDQQSSYNQWILEHAEGDSMPISPEAGGSSRSACLDSTEHPCTGENDRQEEAEDIFHGGRVILPRHILEYGTLNLRTLMIPYYRSGYDAMKLIDRLDKDCRIGRGEPENLETDNSPSCLDREEDMDDLIRLRLQALRRVDQARNSFHDEVKSLIPLTLTVRWPEHKTEAHLEPEQLPDGFMQQLASLQSVIDVNIKEASILEAEYADRHTMAR